MQQDNFVCSFSVRNGCVEHYSELGSEAEIPWEFRNGVSAAAVLDFLYDRLPEPNRQDLLETCEKAGIKCDAVDIIKHSAGQVIDDDCWIKMKDGPQSYKEALVCAGFDYTDCDEIKLNLP